MRLPPLKNQYLTGMGSLKTGILLMVALTLVSIYGTLMEYEVALQKVFYAGWFRVLLILLATNLVLCTYQTLAKRVLPSFDPPFPKSQEFYEEGPMRVSVESAIAADQVEATLRSRGFKTARSGEEGEYIRARRGQFRALAAPLAHVGFIIMLAAAFASGFLAFNGSIRLVEGQSTTEMWLTGDDSNAKRPLGFTLRCLDFETGMFPQTQIPSRFISTLRIEDGATEFIEKVEVNRALKYKGLKFHQSGFDEVKEGTRHGVLIIDTTTSTSVQTAVTGTLRTPIPELNRDFLLHQSMAGIRYTIYDGDEVVGSGFFASDISDLQIMAVQFLPDFVLGADNKAVSRSNQMNNPALRVAWIRDGEVVSAQWLFKNMPNFSHNKDMKTRLVLVNITPGADSILDFHLDAYDAESNTRLGHFEIRLNQTLRIADLGFMGGHGHGDSEETTGTATTPDVSGGYRVKVLEPETLYYTGLSVSHNPMIPLIYLGSILACMGVCFALYLRKTTLWVLCRKEDGRVLVAVQYAPDRSDLTPKVEKTLEALKKTTISVSK